MKDWKSAVRTWEKRSNDRPVTNKSSPVSDMTPEKRAKIHNFSSERQIDYEALGTEFVNL